MKRNKAIILFQIFAIIAVICIGNSALIAQDSAESISKKDQGKICFNIKKWSEWIVEIKDKDGNLKKVFKGLCKGSGFDKELYWDGKDGSGNLVQDGVYNYRVKNYWDAVSPVSELTAFGDVMEIEGKLYAGLGTEYSIAAKDSGRPCSGVSVIYYSINNSEWLKYNGPIKFDAEGLYTISYKAEDVAGNMEAEKMVSVIVDETPPEIIITSPDKKYYSQEVTISVEFTDLSPLVVSSVVLDGAVIKNGQVISEEGSHNLIAIANDAANNYANNSVNFTIDREPPVVNISGVCDNGKYSSVSPVIEILDENLLKVKIFLNDELILEGDKAKFEIQKIDEVNEYVLSVKAEDKANNVTEEKVTFSIEKVDESLLFSANYDESRNADYSIGSGKEVLGNECVINDSEGLNSSGALSAKGSDKGAVYEAKDNIDEAQGTVMMWVKPDWKNINKDKYFFSLNNNNEKEVDLKSCNPDEFVISLVFLKDAGLVVQIKDVEGNLYKLEIEKENVWYNSGVYTHLAFGWDSGTGEMRLYINGELMDTREGLNGWTAKGMLYFWVGNRHNDASKTSESLIDGFRIYNKLLTGDDIKEVISQDQQ